MEIMAMGPYTGGQRDAPSKEAGAGPEGTLPCLDADDGAARLLILRPPVPLDRLRQALRHLAVQHSVRWRS
ncbi:MAG: hypothetical protein C4289_17450 [Chloroflexota bacterium]